MTINQLLAKFEAEHIDNIGIQRLVINSAFNDLAKEVAPILKKWRKPPRGKVWNRNKNVKNELQQALSKFKHQLTSYIGEEVGNGWNLANSKNDLLVQTYLGNMALPKAIEMKMFDRNLDAMKAFQKRKAGGMNLSNRVWNITADTQRQLELLLESGIMTGRSATKMAGDIKQYLVDPDKRFRRIRDPETGKLKLSQPAKAFKAGPGRYRSSYQNALRLTATETNMAYRLADQTRWQNIDFIMGYEVKLSHRHPEVDICDHMKGEYPKGFKFLGWHPRCFCYTVPVLLTKEEFADYINTGKIPNEKYIDVLPANAKGYIGDNSERFLRLKSQPYWLADNFRKSKQGFTPLKRTGLPTDLIKIPETIMDYNNKNGLLHNINLGFKGKQDSFELYSKNGKFIPERQKLHDDIINKILGQPGEKSDWVYSLGGATANGKSTVTKSGFLKHPKGAVTLDSDSIKDMLPEYRSLLKTKDKRAAAFCHEESSFIMKKALQKCLDTNRTFVMDGVGNGSFDKLASKIKHYRSTGKKVRADYCTLDTDLSRKLAEGRYKRTGRYVPEEILLDFNKKIPKLLPDIIDNKLFDELYLWDTNINKVPRLILKQINGKLTIYEPELYQQFLKKAYYEP